MRKLSKNICLRLLPTVKEWIARAEGGYIWDEMISGPEFSQNISPFFNILHTKGS